MPGVSNKLPLSAAGQAALESALLHDLGTLPFSPGALISRSLWIFYIGAWGVQSRATLPVDDRLGMPDQENIAGLCHLVAMIINSPLCHDDEKTLVVLHRPAPPEISEADAHIFRLMRQAVADRNTTPWAFHVVGPAGARQVTEHEAPHNG